MKFESGWYMASTSQIDNKYNSTMGCIQTVNTKTWGIARKRLSAGVPWCLDNGVFTGQFEETYWKQYIKRLMEFKETCVFLVMPDVVGDALSTLMRFKVYRDMIKRDYGLPVALVSQDGISKYNDLILWNDFECLFVGGSDEHKLGKEGGWIINEAKVRGKWVHIGRVNSPKRIKDFWRADSWDGTHLGFNPSSVGKFHAAVLQVRSMKKTKGLFDVHTYVSRRYHSGKLIDG